MTPKEETLEWLKKQVDKEKEKWEVGSKNKYISWDDWYKSLLLNHGEERTVSVENPCNNCMLRCANNERNECERYNAYQKTK